MNNLITLFGIDCFLKENKHWSALSNSYEFYKFWEGENLNIAVQVYIFPRSDCVDNFFSINVHLKNANVTISGEGKSLIAANDNIKKNLEIAKSVFSEIQERI